MVPGNNMISVWFFVGILLTVYGFVVFLSGIYHIFNPPDTVAAFLHAGIWWGIIMITGGLIFIKKNMPKKKNNS